MLQSIRLWRVGCDLAAEQQPYVGGSEYIKQIVMYQNGETESNTIIVGHFNTPLTVKDGTSLVALQ